MVSHVKSKKIYIFKICNYIGWWMLTKLVVIILQNICIKSLCYTPKNWYFQTVVLEKTLEGPLDCKEIKAVNPKGNQSWIFIGRTNAEAPILWPPDAKSRLIRKDPDTGKDWRLEEKGATEDEMVGWHHWLSRHEFEQTPGNSEGQGSLDMTEQLNSNEQMMHLAFFYMYTYRHFNWKH